MDRVLLRDLFIIGAALLVYAFYLPAMRNALKTGVLPARYGQKLLKSKNPASFYLMLATMSLVALALTVFAVAAVYRLATQSRFG